MDHLKAKFVEEATDNINDLEEGILLLEQTPDDSALIERIFRAMHSLKGGGAMFGFDNISDFTHDLETIYDHVRNGKYSVNRLLLDITLDSIDHLKVLLEDDGNDSNVIASQNALLSRIRTVIEEITSGKAQKTKNLDSIVNELNAGAGGSNEKTFFIRFKPGKEIFNNGTNPLFLVDELCELGTSKSFSHFGALPEFKKFEPTSCYTSWDIILTTEDENLVSDVFIFVEDECEIQIEKLSDSNLFSSEEFESKLNDLDNSKEEVNLEELVEFSKTIKVAVKEVFPSIEEVAKKIVKVGAKETAISSIRVSSAKIDTLMNLVSEFVTTQARLSLYAESQSLPELSAIAENIQKLSRQLRDNAFSISLIPIQNMITRFQRLVRDLSTSLNKEISFNAEGTETELDKTIIESLTDPLLHIIRNSIDHGIESPEERLKAGKPTEGQINLKAFYSGANVCIQISDDGKGIDHEKIFQKAVDKGLVAEDAVLTKKEILDFIFVPGFSTAQVVSDVSGRGVGMDVVRRKISDIRGEIELESNVGEGTIITIKLPLTLSIIDGLLVQIKDTFFIVPLSAIDKCYAINKTDLDNSFNDIVVLDDHQISYVHLRDKFDIQGGEKEHMQLVVVKYNDVEVGFTVDSIIGESQAVLKPLSKLYKEQDFISGATILGDGSVALVMDPNKIIQRFSNKDNN